ncbi:hypothetical protein [Lacrimispora sp.]|uniref:hypothetical protein n=1 Tax=Lacrimispora sp. TaxID=2719234 RepID=UPI00345FF7DE
MADLGKVVVTDGGTYSASVTYEKLTFVHYGSNTYMTLKTVKGITPNDDGVNYKLFCRSAELATATVPGTVKPDGTTTAVDSNGTLSAKTATQSTAGIVKGSSGIKVASGGALDVNTAFTQATELANIIANEAIATVLGKVSKAIATTMNLDQNAVLKNMMTNINVNDQNKVPTAAFIHTLYERIGMGEDLDIGANLTAVVKAQNSNLNDKFLLNQSDFNVTSLAPKTGTQFTIPAVPGYTLVSTILTLGGTGATLGLVRHLSKNGVYVVNLSDATVTGWTATAYCLWIKN